MIVYSEWFNCGVVGFFKGGAVKFYPDHQWFEGGVGGIAVGRLHRRRPAAGAAWQVCSHCQLDWDALVLKRRTVAPSY